MLQGSEEVGDRLLWGLEDQGKDGFVVGDYLGGDWAEQAGDLEVGLND